MTRSPIPEPRRNFTMPTRYKRPGRVRLRKFGPASAGPCVDRTRAGGRRFEDSGQYGGADRGGPSSAAIASSDAPDPDLGARLDWVFEAEDEAEFCDRVLSRL